MDYKKIFTALLVGVLLFGCISKENTDNPIELNKEPVIIDTYKLINEDQHPLHYAVDIKKELSKGLWVLYECHLFIKNHTIDTKLSFVKTSIVDNENKQNTILADNFNLNNIANIETNILTSDSEKNFYLQSMINYDNKKDTKRSFNYFMLVDIIYDEKNETFTIDKISYPQQ